ncbi:MAG: type II toxin-antitoxin system Phd/YefM family antitoxin [Acidobacteriaceae bacterium]
MPKTTASKLESKPVNIYDAKAKFSELVERAAAGEEIIIAKAGRPKARLVPLKPAGQKLKPRKFGQNYLGVTYISPDFDAPMTDEELAEWGM